MLRYVVALAALALAQPASAAGDAEAGRQLALGWCAECHVVKAEPARAVVDSAPPFTALANDPTKTNSYLRAWLFDPHLPMPKLELSRGQIDDLVAYMESLRAP